MKTPTHEVCPDIAIPELQNRMGLLGQHQIISLSKWTKMVGLHRTTIYQWRKKGWLKPSVVIQGKWFLTIDDLAEFMRRAKAGDFAHGNKKAA